MICTNICISLFFNYTFFSDSSLIDTVAILDTNEILNIDTSNVISNVEDIYTIFDNFCDIEQYSVDDKNNNMRSCDANKIRDLAHLPKNTFIIDKNSNKLLNTNNIINGKISTCIC